MKSSVLVPVRLKLPSPFVNDESWVDHGSILVCTLDMESKAGQLEFQCVCHCYGPVHGDACRTARHDREGSTLLHAASLAGSGARDRRSAPSISVRFGELTVSFLLKFKLPSLQANHQNALYTIGQAKYLLVFANSSDLQQ
ncbi:hypothetical protein CBL_05327 [Carabus blaptoides fortunei]